MLELYQQQGRNAPGSMKEVANMFGPKAIYTGSIAELNGTEVEVMGRNHLTDRWVLLLPNGDTLTNVRVSSFHLI